MVVFDPRRTETAKVADEHHFVRPGTDALVLLAMVHTLFDEGLDHSPAVRPWARVGAAGGRRTSRRSTPSSAPASRQRRSAAIVREFAAADGAAAYGRMGLSTQGFGSICQWAINCLNILTGNFDREGGVLFPEPAVDIVGKAIVGRGHHDVWRSRVRGHPGVRRRAAGQHAARGDRDARRRADPRDAHHRRQPGALHARRQGAGPGARQPRLHGGGRHLPQRDHPPRRRDPAADHRAGARAVRPRLPHLRRAQHRAVHPAGLREARRRDARLGDLPRDRPAHGGPPAPEEVTAPRP